MFNNKFKNRRGVSLTLITGLVSLLMITSAAMSELIIANMRSVQRIEASNKAYFAAEAGLEDALYELSSRNPGYETPSLGTATVRSTNFETASSWKNEWQIESRSKEKIWSGKIFKNEKLMIFLFKDTNNNKEDNNFLNGDPKGVDENAINSIDEDPKDTLALNVSDNFSIKFTIPTGVIENGKLKIDNDEDNLLNEDSSDDSDPIINPKNPEDADKDGLVDEDGGYDPIILWKLTDGAGRSLMAKKGCLNDVNTPGSEICEDNFSYTNPYISLDHSKKGINQDDREESIKEFIDDTIYGDDTVNPTLPANKNAQLHFEFLIIAPMEHVQGTVKKEIPHIEYEVKSDSTQIPKPYYTIKSDGFYREFKQSITAYLTPKTTVPLFDFTIIQQQ